MALRAAVRRPARRRPGRAATATSKPLAPGAKGHERQLVGSIVQALSDRIATRSLSAGYRISEQDICAEFDVSRSSAREALAGLQHRGLVVRPPNRSAVVTTVPAEEIDEPVHGREVLEGLCFRLATGERAVRPLGRTSSISMQVRWRRLFAAATSRGTDEEYRCTQPSRSHGRAEPHSGRDAGKHRREVALRDDAHVDAWHAARARLERLARHHRRDATRRRARRRAAAARRTSSASANSSAATRV